MTAICYANQELIIALQSKVIFVNPVDLQIFKELELPPDLTKRGFIKPGVTRTDTTEDEVTKGGKDEQIISELERPTIQQVAISPNQMLFAVATINPKAMLLYQCRPEHAKLLSVRALARASSALTFSSDSALLLLTDKTGDCYQYDCVQVDSEARLLLGHLSIVFDVLWTPDMKHIITCDRDDKIRVSRYPETYDIQGYCLGHREFIAGMTLLAKNELISVSGDKTLRIWNYISGKELCKFELPAPGVQLTVRGPLATREYEAAVLLYQSDESVGVYKLTPPFVDGAESWKVSEIQRLIYPNTIVTNLCFMPDRLLIVGSVNGRFSLMVAPIEKAPPNWLPMVEEQFADASFPVSDVSSWFKKRYDNITDYLARKKRRIQEKELKQSN